MRFVVEYALCRNMSPTMTSEYRAKLISKKILQKKLEKLTEILEVDKKGCRLISIFKL